MARNDHRRNNAPPKPAPLPRQTPAPTTSMSRAKYVTYEGLKFMIYVGVIVISMVVFVLTSQAAQDTSLIELSSDIERIEIRHNEHVDAATEVFHKIDRTLVSQQEVLTKTREALIRLDESNRRIAEQVKELTLKDSE